MTREEVIGSLVRFERPAAALEMELLRFEWDWTGSPLAVVDLQAVISVLRRYRAGELTAEDVESWANLIEVRDDIEFEADAQAAVFDLANPVLQGPLDEVASRLLAGSAI